MNFKEFFDKLEENLKLETETNIVYVEASIVRSIMFSPTNVWLTRFKLPVFGDGDGSGFIGALSSKNIHMRAIAVPVNGTGYYVAFWKEGTPAVLEVANWRNIVSGSVSVNGENAVVNWLKNKKNEL